MKHHLAAGAAAFACLITVGCTPKPTQPTTPEPPPVSISYSPTPAPGVTEQRASTLISDVVSQSKQTRATRLTLDLAPHEGVDGVSKLEIDAGDSGDEATWTWSDLASGRPSLRNTGESAMPTGTGFDLTALDVAALVRDAHAFSRNHGCQGPYTDRPTVTTVTALPGNHVAVTHACQVGGTSATATIDGRPMAMPRVAGDVAAQLVATQQLATTIGMKNVREITYRIDRDGMSINVVGVDVIGEVRRGGVCMTGLLVTTRGRWSGVEAGCLGASYPVPGVPLARLRPKVAGAIAARHQVPTDPTPVAITGSVTDNGVRWTVFRADKIVGTYDEAGKPVA